MEIKKTKEYEYSETSKGIEIIRYIGCEKNLLEIPEQINGLPVRVIGKSGFILHKYLKILVIPSSVREIKDFAFSDGILEELIILPGVKVIGEFAFNSNKLLKVILPEGLEVIKSYAFTFNYLKEITIPSSVKFIGFSAFDVERVFLPVGFEFNSYDSFNLGKTEFIYGKKNDYRLF